MRSVEPTRAVRMAIGRALLLTMVLTTSAAACAGGGAGPPAAPTGEEKLRLGKQVLQQSCTQCHAIEKGKASTLAAAPNVADYGTRGPFAAELKRLKESGDPDWLEKWIANAPSIKPGVGMPKWEGVLSPAQIEAAAEYLRTSR